jgi:hypothetical protein
MSAYRVAIHQTVQTLERRAKYFRNQVIAVVIIVLVAVLSACITRSFTPLAGVLLVLPTCGFFFLADTRLVNRWQSEIIANWASGGLDVAALRDAVRACPALPRDTVEGMLATLPSVGHLVAEQRILPPTRQAAATLIRSVCQRREESLLFTVLAAAVASAALLIALWSNTWTPLLGIAALTLYSPINASLTRRRRRAMNAEVEILRHQAGFSEEGYGELLADLSQ